MTKLDFFVLQTGRLDQGGRVTGWLVTLSNRLLRLLRPLPMVALFTVQGPLMASSRVGKSSIRNLSRNDAVFEFPFPLRWRWGLVGWS